MNKILYSITIKYSSFNFELYFLWLVISFVMAEYILPGTSERTICKTGHKINPGLDYDETKSLN